MVTNTAPKKPDRDSDALDILQRIEPGLARLVADNAEFRKELAEFRKEQAEFRKETDLRLRKIETDMARMDGRLIELSSRVPSIWTVAALIVTIFGLSFALLRLGLPHP